MALLRAASWLPVWCAIGFAVACVAASEIRELSGSRRLLVRIAAEIGVAGGVAYYLVSTWVGLTGAFGAVGAGRWVLVQMGMVAVIWSLVCWPFTMWRLERRLGMPYYKSYDATTRICGVTLLLFLVVTAARHAWAAFSAVRW
jgi:hypothetical protein